eukprot:496048-Lingulodinium_polyedra.AAC.1
MAMLRRLMQVVKYMSGWCESCPCHPSRCSDDDAPDIFFHGQLPDECFGKGRAGGCPNKGMHACQQLKSRHPARPGFTKDAQEQTQGRC